MNFWYTARNIFSPIHDKTAWENYIQWSRLTHLREVISLDTMLCELAFTINHDHEETYKHLIIDNYRSTYMFNSLDFVTENVQDKEYFNLLATLKEPEANCDQLGIVDFEFVGYDLVDKYYNISALTNCGGFDETFVGSDLNTSGLIDSYDVAFNTRERLLTNNPDEEHADCLVFAIWRHKHIGRV